MWQDSPSRFCRPDADVLCCLNYGVIMYKRKFPDFCVYWNSLKMTSMLLHFNVMISIDCFPLPREVWESCPQHASVMEVTIFSVLVQSSLFSFFLTECMCVCMRTCVCVRSCACHSIYCLLDSGYKSEPYLITCKNIQNRLLVFVS